MSEKKYNVAVVGATGAVGEEIFRVLEELEFPVGKIIPLASARSMGKSVSFNGKDISVVELTQEVFAEHNIEIALFSAGGSISAEFAESAVKAGAVVIDNTSHFRMDTDIPLVVPEVNPMDIKEWKKKGIIANPNCSTIQMVQAVKPLDEAFDLVRIDVSTYQATSGAGNSAMKELFQEMQDMCNFQLNDDEEDDSKDKEKVFPHQIVNNVIPQIDVFTDNGFTKEEMKMVNETTKILHKEVELAATCVRVPTFRGHAESLKLTFDSDITADEARTILAKAENIVIIDNPMEGEYPMPASCVGQNETFVGRIREDLYQKNVLHLWVVADNLRVGAATNAVRVALKWIELEG